MLSLSVKKYTNLVFYVFTRKTFGSIIGGGKDVMKVPWVKKDDCIKCKICVNICPVEGAIRLESDGYPYINNDVCTRCGICMEKCPKSAIRPNYENPALRSMGRGRGRGMRRGLGRGMGRGFGMGQGMGQGRRWQRGW